MLRVLSKVGTAFAMKWLSAIDKGVPRGPKQAGDESQMRYSRYDDTEAYWDRRLRNATCGRTGFAWGAFFIGLIIGGIIF